MINPLRVPININVNTLSLFCITKVQQVLPFRKFRCCVALPLLHSNRSRCSLQIPLNIAQLCNGLFTRTYRMFKRQWQTAMCRWERQNGCVKKLLWTGFVMY